jgi:hypothetical protein
MWSPTRRTAVILSKLSGKQQAGWMAEGVQRGMDVDVGGPDISVLVEGVVRHCHVALSNCLSLDSSKMNSLGLGIILDDVDYQNP